MDRQRRQVETFPHALYTVANAMQLGIRTGGTEEGKKTFQGPVIAEIADAEQAENADPQRRRTAGGHRVAQLAPKMPDET